MPDINMLVETFILCRTIFGGGGAQPNAKAVSCASQRPVIVFLNQNNERAGRPGRTWNFPPPSRAKCQLTISKHLWTKCQLTLPNQSLLQGSNGDFLYTKSDLQQMDEPRTEVHVQSVFSEGSHIQLKAANYNICSCFGKRLAVRSCVGCRQNRSSVLCTSDSVFGHCYQQLLQNPAVLHSPSMGLTIKPCILITTQELRSLYSSRNCFEAITPHPYTCLCLFRQPQSFCCRLQQSEPIECREAVGEVAGRTAVLS